jgi:hypothetical protein
MGNLLGSKILSKRKTEKSNHSTENAYYKPGENSQKRTTCLLEYLPVWNKRKKNIFNSLDITEQTDSHQMSIVLQPTVKQTASVRCQTFFFLKSNSHVFFLL